VTTPERRDLIVAPTKTAGWAYARKNQIQRPIILSIDPAGQRGLTLDERWRVHIVKDAVTTAEMADKWVDLLMALHERAAWSGHTLESLYANTSGEQAA
jgi:hypothetical protein